MSEPTAHAPAERSPFSDVAALSGRVREECAALELLDFVPDMVMILNRERQIVYANRAVLARAGVQARDQVTGFRFGDLLNCQHASEGPGGCGTTDACRYCGAVNGVLESQGGRPATEECRIVTAEEAGEFPLDLRVFAQPIDLGGVPCTFFAAVDIAHEKRRLFLERIFLHDIMNTATAIRGFSRLLEQDSSDVEERADFVGRLGTLSERMIGEIDAHRQLLAAEQGTLDVHVKRMYAGEFLEEIHATYNRPDLVNRRWLRLATDSADVALDSDPVLLGRVVGNMIKNAVEASAPGDTVTIGCREGDAGVEFWVHNPSVMAEHVRLQIFERSFSTKGDGRGLGTYSMKFLSERLLGGRVSFSSTEEDGTTFVVSCPRAAAPALAA
jgi:signal transduction histidine kinase